MLPSPNLQRLSLPHVGIASLLLPPTLSSAHVVPTIRCPFALCLFLLLSLFALTTPLYSQPYPEAIEVLRRYEQRPGVRVTALVRDLQTGEPVLAHRTSEAFRPASLVKIPTTGAFLALRGHDYRFHIPVMIRGQVDGETLHGDLVLKASADPSLGSHYIPNQKRLISEVKALLEERGITRITGRLIIDLKGFPRPFFNETWPTKTLTSTMALPSQD